MSGDNINIKIGGDVTSAFLCTLTLMFIYFKLTGVIAWSWWFVFSPILIPIVIFIILIIIGVIAWVVLKLVD